MEISQPQSARFLSNNLEVLGFADPTSALIQAVKELFENALDAIQHSEEGMIAVRVKEVGDNAGFLEVICTDTGSGMHANQIAQLCGNVFATTKLSGSNAQSQCGKFGIGLKAALLYSQNHVSIDDACLKVASTLNSSEFYYAEMVIDPEAPSADNGAIIRKSKRYHVSELHKSFSGTEIRLQLPRPSNLIDALHAIMHYFDTLRYCLDAAVSVEFLCDVPGFVDCNIRCTSAAPPLERFLDAFKCSLDALAHVDVECKPFHVNSLALVPYLDEIDLDGRSPVSVHVMRFANHVPMLPQKDIYSCAIISAIQRGDWKSLGYKCIVSDSIYAPLRLVPLAVNERWSTQESKHLVIAIDVDTYGEPTKFTSLTKTALVEEAYGRGMSQCVALLLNQLAHLHPVLFERAPNPSTLLACHFAPLIATAVSGILVNATFAGVDVSHFEPGNPLHGVQSRLDLEHRVVDIMTRLF